MPTRYDPNPVALLFDGVPTAFRALFALILVLALTLIAAVPFAAWKIFELLYR
jgi:hypothetical protein